MDHDGNAVLVDMRNDKDYRDGHIVNAVHVPADNDPSANSTNTVTARSSFAAEAVICLQAMHRVEQEGVCVGV